MQKLLDEIKKERTDRDLISEQNEPFVSYHQVPIKVEPSDYTEITNSSI